MTLFIVPGLHGSGPRHWQTQWQAQIADAERVEQVNWETPDLDTWLTVLAGQVHRQRGAILVGHSLGATLIVHLSARYKNLEIAGALLVAPADPERCDVTVQGLDSFSPLPKQPLNFPSILVASRTDPYMAFDRARSLANLWDSTFVDAGAAGHINVDSGHNAWPEGLQFVDRLRECRAIRPPLAQGTI